MGTGVTRKQDSPLPYGADLPGEEPNINRHINQIILAAISAMNTLKEETGKDPGVEGTFELRPEQ